MSGFLFDTNVLLDIATADFPNVVLIVPQ